MTKYTLQRTEGTKAPVADFLAQGETMLDAVADGGVFGAGKNDDGTFWLTETCDGYFGVIVTKEQLITLAQELIVMAQSDEKWSDSLMPTPIYR